MVGLGVLDGCKTVSKMSGLGCHVQLTRRVDESNRLDDGEDKEGTG